MTWRTPNPPLTAKQLAVEEILAQLHELAVGAKRIYPNLANDGFGGMLVKRLSQHTFVFQRTGSQERSRWADGADQTREEIQAYMETGKLHEPDRIKGW